MTRPGLLRSRVVSTGSDLFERVKPAMKSLYKGPLTGLAHLKRSRLDRTVFIGVTGSCGKTTTKDLVDAALSQQLRGSKSQDSNNQLYAVARTVLSLRNDSDYCVQELGANSPGSFDPLLRLLRPSIGIITNIGSDHYKSFRTTDATAREKGKLIAALPATGTAVLNADDPTVLALAPSCKGNVITFGKARDAHMRAEAVSSIWPQRLSFDVKYRGQTHAVRTRLCGEHWVSSVLAALATAMTAGVPLDVAIGGVAAVDPWPGRMAPVETADGVTFIRDDWKASFWSVPAALDFLGSAGASRRIAIIGTLSDYGGTSYKKYRSVAKHALEVADHVVFVGSHSNSALRLAERQGRDRLRVFGNIGAANHFIQSFLRPGDLVLIKGSNSDHLARIALARQRTVKCWRSSCPRRQLLCDRCVLLGVESPVRSE